jgi:hypothetical protein
VSELKEEEWSLCMTSSFFFEMITFAIISILAGFFLEVFLVVTRVIVASIIVVATVVLAFITIALVASVLATVLAMMMLVVQTMAGSNRKMSCFLLLQLFLFLELVKDTSHFVGSLALLKKRPQVLEGP